MDGKQTGKAKKTWSNGDIYEGDFVDGQLNGKAKKTLANGDIYEGDFVNGQLNGECKISTKNDDFHGYVIEDTNNQFLEKYGIQYGKNGEQRIVYYSLTKSDVDFNEYKKYFDGSFRYYDYITLETNPAENNIDALLKVTEAGGDETLIFFQENYRKKIHASKAILANNSDTLKNYFETEVGSAIPRNDATHFFTKFKGDNPGADVTYDIIKKLLYFIYKGRFENPEDNKNATLQHLIVYLQIRTNPSIEIIEKNDGNRPKKLSSIKKKSKKKSMKRRRSKKKTRRSRSRSKK